jgi:hypothetical protein
MSTVAHWGRWRGWRCSSTDCGPVSYSNWSTGSSLPPPPTSPSSLSPPWRSRDARIAPTPSCTAAVRLEPWGPVGPGWRGSISRITKNSHRRTRTWISWSV